VAESKAEVAHGKKEILATKSAWQRKDFLGAIGPFDKIAI
jgi:hypothetical protein